MHPRLNPFWAIKRLVMNPRLKITSTNLDILKLGSSYGGWSFVPTDKLRRSVIISAGLGEDASFDVEIASKYSLKVIFLDPTPRAIKHFEEMEIQFCKHKSENYSSGGNQNIQSYEMRDLDSDNFDFIPKALWNKKTKMKFFKPENSSHVSHSLINFQFGYSVDTDYLEVACITLKDVLEYSELQSIPLFKLDIEGAEIEVLEDMLSNEIYPNQILVEYDELNYPSLRGRKRVLDCHGNLIAQGYKLIHRDMPSNFLYLKDLSQL